MLKLKAKQRFLSALIVVCFLIMSGCAGKGIELVAQNISNVEVMINQARQEQAETYAPLELKLAEESLEEAKEALKNKEPEIANRKAEMAKEHARVADARSRAEKAKKQTQNEEKNLNMLRDEIDRAQKVKE
ncbi:DUF4398 [Desulfonema limicola]|uniref:DUF4398 n=1 Tax=Desulfonema limicola TaxID=45656 RepID=A0A975BCI6_9BACT|nr:DUF4398 domain-containing protein [Desulfonema limicola]QTA82689.1 DUF4398 [Desulfonema limicola]